MTSILPSLKKSYHMYFRGDHRAAEITKLNFSTKRDIYGKEIFTSLSERSIDLVNTGTIFADYDLGYSIKQLREDKTDAKDLYMKAKGYEKLYADSLSRPNILAANLSEAIALACNEAAEQLSKKEMERIDNGIEIMSPWVKAATTHQPTPGSSRMFLAS